MHKWVLGAAALLSILTSGDSIAGSTQLCSYGHQQRLVSIVNAGAERSVPCQVQYTRRGTKISLWHAHHERGYCEAQAAAFVQKQIDWGWKCAPVADAATLFGVPADPPSGPIQQSPVPGDDVALNDAGASAVPIRGPKQRGGSRHPARLKPQAPDGGTGALAKAKSWLAIAPFGAALSAATPVKPAVEEFYQVNGRMPDRSADIALDDWERAADSRKVERKIGVDGQIWARSRGSMGIELVLMLKPLVTAGSSWLQWQCVTSIDVGVEDCTVDRDLSYP